MRIVTVLAAGGIAVAAVTASGHAAPVTISPGLSNGAAPDIEDVAAHHCGPHAHYLAGHRARNRFAMPA